MIVTALHNSAFDILSCNNHHNTHDTEFAIFSTQHTLRYLLSSVDSINDRHFIRNTTFAILSCSDHHITHDTVLAILLSSVDSINDRHNIRNITFAILSSYNDYHNTHILFAILDNMQRSSQHRPTENSAFATYYHVVIITAHMILYLLSCYLQ